MRHFTLLCLLALFSITNLHANNTPIVDGSITGKVIDATLKQPLPYVNIIIKNDKGDIVTGSITADDGSFKVGKIPDGKLTVSVQFIGYQTINKSITINKKNKNIDLGTIALEEQAEGLDEVTVVAETSTIRQKVDRKVITVGKDLTTTGPTASDIMNNLPSVSVDQQTGDISLRGNQNVRVMVDGKLSNIPAAQLLKQIPSTAIKSIELITNPSAKYNPEGMSGIINIILHKNTNIGFNGNVNFGLSYQDEPKFNSSIDMNYRNGKFNFYGNYGNNISKNLNYGNIFRVEDNIDQYINNLDSRQSHLFKVGVDFYLNDKNTISFFTNQNIYDGSATANTDIVYNDSPALNTGQSINNNNDNTSQQYNFDYKLEFDKEGHSIELEVDHNIYDGNSYTNNTLYNSSRPNFKEDTGTGRNRTTINLDYVNPLTERTKLELGLQARLFDNTIDYYSNAREQDQLGNYTATSTLFDYKRNIYSAYATYGKKLEKWSYQVGLRAENVEVTADAFKTFIENDENIATPFKNDYFQLYPSAFFTYNPSEKNSYQLSYSRRVDRPGIGQVNPLPEWNTPLISSFGNQELRPQFTNSIELNYTRQLTKGSITAGVFYRIIEDEINRALFIDRDDLDRQILTYNNFDNTTAYGFEFSTNYRPTKWWSMNGSLDLYSQTQKSIAEVFTVPRDQATANDIALETFKVDNIAFNMRLFNNFRVSKSLSFSAFGFYRGKNKSVQFEVDPMYFVNLGMRLNFLEDNRATFNLNYNDIFNTMKFAFKGERPYAQSGAFNWESQTVYAGLSYRFGGSKYRAKSRKKRDNDIKSGSGGFM